MKSSTKTILGGLCVALLGLLSVSPAPAQIYQANYSSGTISEYNFDGTLVNSSLVSGLHGPYGLTIAGSDIFVTDSLTGTVGEYTTSGETVNASLITGLALPQGIAVSGSDIYVSNAQSGTIGEYTTSGATVNASLITGLSGSGGIAIAGSNLFVTSQGGDAYGMAHGTVGEYTTSGMVENASLVYGLDEPTDLVVSGSNIFVSVSGGNFGDGLIGEYTTAGKAVNTDLVDFGDEGPHGIALAGTDLYVIHGPVQNTTGEYTTAGTPVKASLISNSSLPEYLVIGNPDTGGPALNPTTTVTSVSAGSSYANVAPVTSTGGLGTTTSLLGGTATSDKTVTVSTTNLATQFKSLASDVVSVSGIDPAPDPTNTFVLQLTFDLNAANEIGGADAARLLWLDPATGKWENAVDGDSDGGISAHFVLGMYNANTDFHLGYYGVDTVNDTVWAVIDHNSTFSTGDTDQLPTPVVPEPSTWAMLLGGLALLAELHRRRQASRL